MNNQLFRYVVTEPADYSTYRCPCSRQVKINEDGGTVCSSYSPACGGMCGLLGSLCGAEGAAVGASAGACCPVACALCTGDLRIERVENEVRVIPPAPDLQASVVGAPTQETM